jgi:hypothetical protein
MGAEPHIAYLVAGHRGGVGVHPAVLVAGDWFVGQPACFEVRRCGVEEQDVHIKIKKGGQGPEDLLLQCRGNRVEPVHGPVAGVLVAAGQAGDVHVVGDPVGGGELRRGSQGPVGDQGEQHPFRGRVARATSGALQELVGDLVEVQPSPQDVQDVNATVRAGLDEAELAAGGRGEGLGGVQEFRQRRHEACHRGSVEVVFAAEAVEDLRYGPAGGGIPVVVRQVQVTHAAAVDGPADCALHVHVSRP